MNHQKNELPKQESLENIKELLQVLREIRDSVQETNRILKAGIHTQWGHKL